MSTTSSPQANPVTPSLCWDSSWHPRWDSQCMHPGSPSVSAVFLWLPSLAYQGASYITSPLQPTLRSSVSVYCCETPTSPEIPTHAVITSSVVCDLGPSLTPGDAECLRLLFHPEKEEWWSDIPSSYNTGSPFFSGASSELLSMGLFLATSWAMTVSITIVLCLLIWHLPSLFQEPFLLQLSTIWNSHLINFSFCLNIWNTICCLYLSILSYWVGWT